MKKNSLLVTVLLLVVFVLSFSSCSDDDDNGKPTIVIPNNVVYVLNNGLGGKNNAILSYYDLSANTMTKDIFKEVNKSDLGDLGQHIITYGGKIYISMQNSGRIYVLDKNCKVLKVIDKEGADFSPKMMEAYNGKIYAASYVQNELVRIDTASLKIDKTIAVGMNPEYIKAVNNKIYVANSGGLNYLGGYNNTVSVVDPGLTTEKVITVAVNPTVLKTDANNNLYLLSLGDYGYMHPYSLQKINTSTDAVTVLSEGNGSNMFIKDNRIYLLDKSYDAITYQPSSSFVYYDINTKQIVNSGFITDGTDLTNIDVSTVDIDPNTGRIFMSVSNSTNTGDLYIFSADGKFISKHDTGGVFPSASGVCFVTK